MEDDHPRVQGQVSLATLGSDLPAHLQGSHHQLGLAEEVQARQELNIVLALQWYWGAVFREVTVGGGKTGHLG